MALSGLLEMIVFPGSFAHITQSLPITWRTASISRLPFFSAVTVFFTYRLRPKVGAHRRYPNSCGYPLQKKESAALLRTHASDRKRRSCRSSRTTCRLIGGKSLYINPQSSPSILSSMKSGPSLGNQIMCTCVIPLSSIVFHLS
ncbi:hypothetical protein PIB30_095199 [Stylosanthes scabra]|uniref:Uncharacterized protein n=1 Tax=Stylosanthes scabra TaxID=79078 RepID=A0ABU6YWA9_9FABA|nr:hypothetical protein [Stylosanthes scabra]